MRILIVSDTWHPQTNGVVSVLHYTQKYLSHFGHEVILETPNQWRSIPLIGYKEIRLALFKPKSFYKKLDSYSIDALHIATEGPLGIAARHWAHKRGIKYTTAFHTLFPEYIKKRIPILPLKWLWNLEYIFHHKAYFIFTSTQSITNILLEKGLKNIKVCPFGVDTNFFRPLPKKQSFPSPVWLYVGRMAIEKNVEAFLNLDLPGTKLLVGDGPLLSKFKKQYPYAHFVGKAKGEALVQYYNDSDILVFPSQTDTFGLVILEALACGKPVAAFNVTGPKDILTHPSIGYINDDLKTSCEEALKISPSHCRNFALSYDWKVRIKAFEQNLIDINGKKITHP